MANNNDNVMQNIIKLNKYFTVYYKNISSLQKTKRNLLRNISSNTDKAIFDYIEKKFPINTSNNNLLSENSGAATAAGASSGAVLALAIIGLAMKAKYNKDPNNNDNPVDADIIEEEEEITQTTVNKLDGLITFCISNDLKLKGTLFQLGSSQPALHTVQQHIIDSLQRFHDIKDNIKVQEDQLKIKQSEVSTNNTTLKNCQQKFLNKLNKLYSLTKAWRKVSKDIQYINDIDTYLQEVLVAKNNETNIISKVTVEKNESIVEMLKKKKGEIADAAEEIESPMISKGSTEPKLTEQRWREALSLATKAPPPGNDWSDSE